MDAIQLCIAVIEKAIQDGDDSEEKTIKAEECNSTKHENASSDENKNIIDTEKCTKHDESENKEFTTESLTKPDESENNEITTKSTDSKVTDTAPLHNSNVTDTTSKAKSNVTQDLTVTDDTTVNENKQNESKVKREVRKKNPKVKN